MAWRGSAATAARSAAHPSPAPSGGKTCSGGWCPPGGQLRTPVRQGGAGEEGSGAEQAAELRSLSPQRGTAAAPAPAWYARPVLQPAASRRRGALAGDGTARGGRWGTGGETRPAAALEVRGYARGAMEAGPL